VQADRNTEPDYHIEGGQHVGEDGVSIRHRQGGNLVGTPRTCVLVFTAQRIC
jgi:hypothetical protein